MSESTAHPFHCPQCGAALPAGASEGLCAQCLAAPPQTSRLDALPFDSDAATIAVSGPRPSLPGKGIDLPLPEELTALLPHGMYQVQRFLGAGGMGAVYQGTQVRLKRSVAIKIMRRDMGRDHDFEQRFEREAQAMAKLNHPNIVSVIDYGEAGPDYLYIVMELIDGADLMDVIRGGQMTQEMALSLLPQICDALQFAHDHGIVHRDIKPSNIMLTRDGRIKMADFGLAKRFDVESSFRTQTGTGMGTPDYAAPEQFDPTSAIDHRADIYALGVMIYQMITGQLPRGVWRPPSQRAPVSPHWDAIVSRAMQSDPSDRYQHACEVKTDVSSIPLASAGRAAGPSAAASGPASATSPTTELGGPSDPPKTKTPLLLAVAALAVIITGTFLAFKKPAPNSAPTASASTVSHSASPAAEPWQDQLRDATKLSFDRGAELTPEGIRFPPASSAMFNNGNRLHRDVAVRMRTTFGGPRLQIRVRGSASGFYSLMVQDKQHVVLQRVENGTAHGLGSFALSKELGSGQDYELELRCAGQSLTAKLDNKIIGTVTDGTYQVGSISLCAWEEKPSVRIGYAKSFEVLDLDAPGVALTKPPQAASSAAPKWQRMQWPSDQLTRFNMVPKDGWYQFDGMNLALVEKDKTHFSNDRAVRSIVRVGTKGSGIKINLEYSQSGVGSYYFLLESPSKAVIRRYENNKQQTTLAEISLTPALPLGAEVMMEFAAHGDLLVGRIAGKFIGTIHDGTFPQRGGISLQSAREGISEFKDVEYLDLTGMPRTEALKTLGVDDKTPSATTWQPLFTEDEWRATGLNGEKIQDNATPLRTTKPQPSPDGAIRSHIRFRTGAGAGLVMRQGIEGSYKLAISGNGENVQLFYYPLGSGSGESLGLHKLPKPLQPGDPVTLELHAMGDHLQGFVNGTATIEATDKRIKKAGDWGATKSNSVCESLEVQSLDAAVSPAPASPAPGPKTAWHPPPGPPGLVKCYDFTEVKTMTLVQDDRRLLVTQGGRSEWGGENARLLDLGSGKTLWQVSTRYNEQAAALPDRKHAVLFGRGAGEVGCDHIDLETGNKVATWSGPQDTAAGKSLLAISPTGKRFCGALITRLNDKAPHPVSVWLFDTDSLKPLAEWNLTYNSSIQSLLWLDENRFALYSTTPENKTLQFDVSKAGQPPVPYVPDLHQSVAIAPNRQLLVGTMAQLGYHLAFAPLVGDSPPVILRKDFLTQAVAFSGDIFAALEGNGKTLLVFDVKTRQLLQELHPQGKATQLALSQDGSFAVLRESSVTPDKDQISIYRLRDTGTPAAGPTKTTISIHAPARGDDRAAAKWVLSLGGTVTIQADGKKLSPKTLAELPASPFSLTEVVLEKPRIPADQAFNLTPLARLPELAQVQLKGAVFRDELLSPLTTLPKLNFLGCHFCSVTDESVSQLKKMPALTRLDLHSVKGFTGRRFGELADTAINWLVLQECPLSPEGLGQIARCHKLKFLDIGETGMTDADIRVLAALDQLSELHLENMPITSTGLARLAPLIHLQYLNWSLPRENAAAQVADIAGIFPHLAAISLGKGSPPEGVTAFSAFRKLTRFEINNGAATDDLLQALLKVPQVQHLWLRSPGSISDTGIGHLAAHPALQEVFLENDHRITDAGLLNLAPLKSLRLLRIIRCEKITPTGIDAFTKARPDVKIDAAVSSSSP